MVEENIFLSEPVSFHRLEHRGVRQITLTCCVSLKPLSGLQITRDSSESGDCKNIILWEIFDLSGGEGVRRSGASWKSGSAQYPLFFMTLQKFIPS